MKIEFENGSIIENMESNGNSIRGKGYCVTENIKGTCTNKTCPKCGSRIFSYKRLDGLADMLICSNRKCNGIW